MTRSSSIAGKWNSEIGSTSSKANKASEEAESTGTPEAHSRAAELHLIAATSQLHGRPGVAQDHKRKAAYHQEKAKGSAEPVIKRDPAAPAPTPKPPKVGSLPKPPKPPKPKTTQAGVSMTSVTMKAEKPPHRIVPSGGSSQKYGPCEVCKQSASDIQIYAGRPDGKVTFGHKECLEKLRSKEIHKSEPTAILNAARVDAEVERRLVAIEGVREDLQKGLHPDNKLKYAEEKATNSSQIARDSNDPTHHDNAAFWSRKAAKVAREQGKEALAGYHESVAKFHDSKGTGQQPITKSESDHVKEFVLGLDLGGTRRWHSACISKDDSNLGKAIKGKQADRTYSREGSRGVPGICTGCGGELQMDPAPREVDAPAHGEDHNEHKIEKAEGKTKMPKYVEGRGWTGGEKDRLYHLTDKGTGQKWVKDMGNMRGVGPEVDVRHATRAEAEEMWQKPLHPGWKVSESVEKGYDDEVSKEWVHSHLKELSQRADEHQRAGRKQDADALRAKIKTIKEKHGMGPAPMDLSKGFTPSQKNAIQLSGMAQAFSNDAVKTGERKAHEIAAGWHRKAAKAWGEDTDSGQHHAAKAAKHDEAAKSALVAKSELLAGARHHYARVVRFQQLGKSEEVAKSAAMCALYVAKMGGDPSKDVPAEVRNCGPVDLASASFHLDREVRGLPAKMLPLIKRSKELGKALTGAPGDTAPGATMDGGALQLAEKGLPRTMPHPETGKGGGKPDTRYSIGRSYTGHPSGKPQYVVQFANERIGQHETREGAEALARQHAAKRNADLGFTQKSEKSDVIGEVGKGGGKTLDIGDGYHVHAHGLDANGNHSVWVSKGSGRARKIQSGQNLPSVHSQRGAGEKKGHLPITKQIAKEIKEYHQKHVEKPTKKSECAPAGSPLEKLNAMIKGASSGASLSKAGQDRGQLNAWGQSQKAPASYHQKAQRAMMADHGLGSGHYDNLRPSFDTAWREGKDPKTAAASIVPEYKKMHGLG